MENHWNYEKLMPKQLQTIHFVHTNDIKFVISLKKYEENIHSEKTM